MSALVRSLGRLSCTAGKRALCQAMELEARKNFTSNLQFSTVV